MYVLYWMPNPDTHRDEIDRIYGNQWPELCFRFLKTLHPSFSSLTWTMDGDGWSSRNVWYENEWGQFYISRF